MMCGQFPTCVETFKHEEKPVKVKGLNKSKKKANTTEIKHIYTGYPCGDANKRERCVCFSDTRSKPSCTENGKTYTLDHGGANVEVLCMHIDGGVVDDAESQRCDYAYFVRDKVDHGHGRAIFIELKGSNTRTALKQLIVTLDMPEVNALKRSYKRIYGRVVNTSSVPRIQNTGLYMDLKEKLKRMGGNLKIGEWNLVEPYNKLDIANG
jgi:hypothetical protein